MIISSSRIAVMCEVYKMYFNEVKCKILESNMFYKLIDGNHIAFDFSIVILSFHIYKTALFEMTQKLFRNLVINCITMIRYERHSTLFSYFRKISYFEG